MMIAHPAEYAVMVDRARKATGDDARPPTRWSATCATGSSPRAPRAARSSSAARTSTSSSPDLVDGGLDLGAAKAIIAFATGPEWSTKMAWVGSNPGNLRGFQTKWMKERLEQIKFLDVTTSMLPYGIPFPVLPQSPEIMNIIMPNMMQNALTEKMTVDEAADDAAKKIKDLLGDL